jgi:hypothetical protein
MSYKIPNFCSRIQYFLHQSKLIKMRGQKHRSKMMQRQPSQMNNSGMKVSMTNQKHRSKLMQRQPSQMNNSGMKVSLIVQLNVMVQEHQAYHSVKVGSAPVLLQRRVPNVVSYQRLFCPIFLFSSDFNSHICC